MIGWIQCDRLEVVIQGLVIHRLLEQFIALRMEMRFWLAVLISGGHLSVVNNEWQSVGSYQSAIIFQLCLSSVILLSADRRAQSKRNDQTISKLPYLILVEFAFLQLLGVDLDLLLEFAFVQILEVHRRFCRWKLGKVRGIWGLIQSNLDD